MSLGPTVGVLDWGIGGLDTLRRLRERRPDLALRYLSDSGFTPYGRVSREDLAARVGAIVANFARANVDLVVIACNAASTVLDELAPPCPVLGVIAPGVALAAAFTARATAGRPPARLGILGGERTISSGLHARALLGRGYTPDTLLPLCAQPLSAHVEAGRLDGPALMADLGPLCARLRAFGADAVLLACTHYPALAPVLGRELPGVALLDPVEGLVTEILARLGPAHPDGPHRAPTIATTGDPAAMRLAARLGFGVELGPIDTLDPVTLAAPADRLHNARSSA